MLRLHRFALVWALIVGGGGSAICSAESLKIATYNVENYTVANRMVDGVYREAYPKPEAAKTALRKVIRTLNADVLMLQEMGPSSYLDELRRDLSAEGCVYPFAVVLDAADPDRHVAVLSRRPFVNVVKHTDLEFPYFGSQEHVKRGLLEIRLSTSEGEITLYNVHLKSRYSDRADDTESAIRRGGEATVIRDRILERFPDPERARFIVLGDFNDTKIGRGVRYVLARGKRVISTLVPAEDSRGDAWTYRYGKEDSYSRVDHILISDPLHEALVGGKAQICDLPEVRLASDHRPVSATFQFK